MEYRICDNCKQLVEVIKYNKYEGGNSIITYVCPTCGHKKKVTVNHVHYGNDKI